MIFAFKKLISGDDDRVHDDYEKEDCVDNGDLAVKQHLQMGISVESGRQILKFTPNGIVNKRKCEMYLLIFDKNALVKK